MVRLQHLAIAITAFQIVYANAVDDEWHSQLLKRQEPGTNSYKCHDTCGQAIIGSRSTGYCTNPTFKTNYENCLACAGPDNVNIWNMYGNTLTRAATTCGDLSTTPLSGTQPDIPDAIPATGGVTPSASPPRPSGRPNSTNATAPVEEGSTSRSNSSATATSTSAGVTPTRGPQSTSSPTTSSGGATATGAGSNTLPHSFVVLAMAAIMAVCVTI
ncbi:hypothetical protein HYFRA_00012568 [Hymenoscyphus fraxineus]|uniref:Uncharacterized protein n=1 Tax=Hymenoscyphus fraxineus TaxID=746836 RepID=A0A9N9PXD7_9HELO|nr:hypothetical protein HYFRA_00012568 [Hymenoscyphus fraxineus]